MLLASQFSTFHVSSVTEDFLFIASQQKMKKRETPYKKYPI